MRNLFNSLFTLALLGVPVTADGMAGGDPVRAYVDGHKQNIVADLLGLLRLPNVAANPDDIVTNAKAIQVLYREAGFATEILEAGDGPVALLGEKRFPGAAKTITLYIHMDGQPVDESRWVTPPFSPVLRKGRLEDGAEILDLQNQGDNLNDDWRIYGRSASDDKAPVIALLHALKALESAGVTPSVNLKVLIEGAEEAGSPNLKDLIAKYEDELGSDFWLFLDGPQDQRGNPRVVLGVRGVTGFQLTLYGPSRGLHSGHYGNFAPNPALRLSHLLASMRDERGHVLIKGFYDEVRPEGRLEKELIAAIPDADQLVMEDAGIASHEYPELRYEETLLLPALNIQGLEAGGIGAKARNIIDSRAIAAMGIRLAPDMTLDKTRAVIEAHIENQGYLVIHDREPSMEERLSHPKIARLDWSAAGYPAVRTDPANPYVQKLIRIMQEATNGGTIVYPTLGGSLPLAHVVLPLHVPFAILPIANQDNSQHGPNENIRLGHLFKGVQLYAAVLAQIGKD